MALPKRTFRELSLFTGIGGGLLGSHLLGWRTVAAVEKEPFCRELLLRRQRDGMLPLFPIWDDIRTFNGRPWCKSVDIITCGFPCQPFSIAGKRLCEADPRNLWHEAARIINEVRPKFALLENSSGISSTSYFRTILYDLYRMGYAAKGVPLSCSPIGARTLRRREWILAYSTGERQQGPGRTVDASDTKENQVWKANMSLNADRWAYESRVERVRYAVPYRMDRLTAIGNAQIPGMVYFASRLLGLKPITK